MPSGPPPARVQVVLLARCVALRSAAVFVRVFSVQCAVCSAPSVCVCPVQLPALRTLCASNYLLTSDGGWMPGGVSYYYFPGEDL